MQNIVRSDKAFYFMNLILGSPAYWKKFQLEDLAMIRQLFCPGYLIKLCYADLYWEEILKIIAAADGLRISCHELK